MVTFPPNHLEGPDSIPNQSLWDLWRTERQWDRLLWAYFRVSLSASINQ